MEFVDLVNNVQDFVLKTHHMRHELLDSALTALEETSGDCGVIFVQLHKRESKSEDLLSFLKSIRDVPCGPLHFVNSSSFKEAFNICASSPDLNHVFLQILDEIPVTKLSREMCTMLALKTARWVCHEDASVSETASHVLERICVVDPDAGLATLMVCASHVRDDTTALLRYASIVAQLLSSKHLNGAAPTTAVGGSAVGTVELASHSSSNAPAMELDIDREGMFAACMRHDAIQLILSLSVSSTDLLVQLLGLELLPSFAGSVGGIQYFFEQGHFNWMVAQAASVLIKDPNVDPIIAASSLMEISNLFLKSMQLGTSSSLLPLLVGWRNTVTTADYVDTLAHCVMYHLDNENHSDESGRAAALSAVSAMCSLSPSWLHRVVINQSLMQEWFSLINGGPDTQAALLVSVATILMYHHDHNQYASPAVNGDGDGDGDAAAASAVAIGNVSAVQHTRDMGLLVEAIGLHRVGNMASVCFLVKLASQPIDNLSVAAMQLMTAMATQDSGWGIDMLFSSTKFFPFLTDRTTTSSKAQMEAKHAILVAISKNSRYSHLSDAVVGVLNRHIAAGAYAPAHHAELAELMTL